MEFVVLVVSGQDTVLPTSLKTRKFLREEKGLVLLRKTGN